MMAMSLAEALTILCGLAVIVSGCALGLWQILSAPDRPNYPTSGPIKRGLMFLVMVGLLGRGAEIIAGAQENVLATAWMVQSSLALAALFVVFLIDHCQHWLPAKTHARIRQLVRVARCGPSQGLKDARTSAMVNSTGEPCPAADVVGPALATLAMQGVSVIGPNEKPQAIIDAGG